jgi:hypothetical protein
LLSPNSEEWSDRSSENSRVLTQEFAFWGGPLCRLCLVDITWSNLVKRCLLLPYLQAFHPIQGTTQDKTSTQSQIQRLFSHIPQ